MQFNPTFLLFWEAFPSLAPDPGVDGALAALLEAAQGNEPSPAFRWLEEQLLERLPDPSAYAACDLPALRERCRTSLRARIGAQRSLVLTLRLPGDAREMALEIVREALALGLCVFDSAIATCFRPGARSQRVPDAETWLSSVDLTAAIDLDGEHEELFVRHAFVRAITPALLEAGFERMAGGAAMERAFPGGRQRVHVSGFGSRARVTLSTTHAAVQVLLERIAGPRAGASLGTHTVCLDRLVDEPALFQPDPENLERALARVEGILRERGLNLLDRAQDLRELDLMLNGPAALRWTGFGAGDGRVALTVARLAGNGAFEAVCETYRAQAQGRGPEAIEEMDLLLAVLRDTAALPEQPTAASLAARQALQPLLSARVSRWALGAGLAKLAPTPSREEAAARFRADLDTDVQRYRAGLQRRAGTAPQAAAQTVVDALLDALLPLAEAHGFRRIDATSLVRHIGGGSQSVGLLHSISSESVSMLRVAYGVSFDEVNEVYARAMGASRYDPGGHAAACWLDPVEGGGEPAGLPLPTLADIDRYAREITTLFEEQALPLLDQARTLEGVLSIPEATRLWRFPRADRAASAMPDADRGRGGRWPPVDLVICHLLGDRAGYADRLQRYREAADPARLHDTGSDTRRRRLEQLHAFLQEKMKPRA
jgi:hypothetical protein